MYLDIIYILKAREGLGGAAETKTGPKDVS